MEESFVCDGKDVQELEIKNGVGEITLSKAEDRDINIYVKGKVSGDDMNKCKTILENMYINAVNENGKFTVDVKCKDNKDMNFWNWIEKNYKSYEVNIKLDVKVPEGINVYKAEIGVGNVYLEEIKGEVSVKTGVGDAELSKVILTNKSSVTTGTGNVSLDISDIENSQEIKVTTGVGDINLSIPENSSYTIKSSGFMDDKLEEVVNGGKTLIDLKASVGDVVIDKK